MEFLDETQLEEGSYATEYEPFGETVTIDNLSLTKEQKLTLKSENESGDIRVTKVGENFELFSKFDNEKDILIDLLEMAQITALSISDERKSEIM